MRIKLSSLFVDNQDKALKLYTEVLGFTKKIDLPMGEFQWLTVVSPEGPDDLELVLEPNGHAAARDYQEAIHGDGIPATSFASRDVRKEHERLKGKGVKFTMAPTQAGPTTIAVFDET